MNEAYLKTDDGTELFYRHESPQAPAAVVLICHGYAEHSGRMDGVMSACASKGIAVFAPDHRGHGKTAAKPGLVESFDEIVGDIEALRKVATDAHPGIPIFVLGHSMGGMVAIRYAQTFPDGLAGVIPVAAGILVPPDIPGIMVKLSHFLGSLFPSLPVQPFFDPSKVTRIPAERQKLLADPLIYKGMIRAKTGSELLHAMNASVDGLSAIQMPILVIHGEADIVVAPEASELIRDGVHSEDLTYEIIPNAYHDIFHEPEAEHVFALVAGWILERATK